MGSTVDGVDVLFDTVGGPQAFRLTGALRDGGILAPIFMGDYHPDELQRRGIVQRFGQVHTDAAQLTYLAESAASGDIVVALDGIFALHEAWKAHERAERGHLQGKLVLDAAPA